MNESHPGLLKATKKIWLPGDQKPEDVQRKLITPAKSILTPVDATGKKLEQPAETELQIAKRFNRKERREHVRISIRLTRRARRAELKRALRLDKASFAASDQRYDPELHRTVRHDHRGKEIPIVQRPMTVKVRPKVGYFQANGPAVIRKSAAQQELEANGIPQAVTEVKRVKRPWPRPPLPSLEELAA